MGLQYFASVFFAIFLLLPSSSSPERVSRCHPQDSEALFSFWNSFQAQPLLSVSICKISWNQALDCCSLSDVDCDNMTGHVIGLRFTNFCQGTISSNSSLFKLRHLQSLQISDCNLQHSSIPQQFGMMENLQLLDLSSINISGSIPAAICNLKHLRTLHLSRNLLTGKIPDCIFDIPDLQNLELTYNYLEGSISGRVPQHSNLQYLDLSYNHLDGIVPAWLFAIPSLISIDLSYNNLTGPIESFQRSAAVSLINLALNNNKIHGPIPSYFFQLVNLTHLYLNDNNFSGVIRWSMFKEMVSLTDLCLSNNRELSWENEIGPTYVLRNLFRLEASSCNLTEFPSFLHGAEYLDTVNISNNRIRGQIATRDSIGLKYLRVFDGSHNLITGFDELPTFLMVLVLRNNQLGGEITSMFCNASQIEILDLSHNYLSSVLPPCLMSLRNLSILNLQNNLFHGAIPDTFGSSCSYEVLVLGDNNFQGILPRSLNYCPRLAIFDVGNNNITDTFPTFWSASGALQILILSSNNFHGEIKGNISAFRILDLSNNNFSGFLPTQYFEDLESFGTNTFVGSDTANRWYRGSDYTVSWTIKITIKGSKVNMNNTPWSLIMVDFSSNQLSGEIPSVIGNNQALKVVNFGNNMISGHIPSSIGNMSKLESLDLPGNKISGEIPKDLMNLSALDYLNLANNKLQGPIPKGKQFSNLSFAGNKGLCGPPMSKLC